MGQLEALKTIATLRFLPDDIHDRVDQFGALGVMALGPIVAGPALAEYEVVGAEELTEGTRSGGVHCARFEVDQDGTRNILFT